MKRLGMDIVEKGNQYTMTFHCDNCHEAFIEIFEKGERAHQGECPNCGVSPRRESRYNIEKTY